MNKRPHHALLRPITQLHDLCSIGSPGAPAFANPSISPILRTDWSLLERILIPHDGGNGSCGPGLCMLILTVTQAMRMHFKLSVRHREDTTETTALPAAGTPGLLLKPFWLGTFHRGSSSLLQLDHGPSPSPAERQLTSEPVGVRYYGFQRRERQEAPM